MLGHYDAGFTLRTYTHATRQMQDQAAETMGNFMNQMMQPHPRATKTPGRKAKFVCQSLVTARSCLADTSTTARHRSESGRRLMRMYRIAKFNGILFVRWLCR